MKAVVAAFNQEKALVGAFSVITNLRMDLFEALVATFIFQLPASSLSKHNINAFYGQQLPQSRYLYLYQVCLTSCNVIQQCSNNVAACLRLASDVKGPVTIKSVHCQWGDLCWSCCEVKVVGENNKNQLVSVPKEMLKTSKNQEQSQSRKMTHTHKLLTTSTTTTTTLRVCAGVVAET